MLFTVGMVFGYVLMALTLYLLTRPKVVAWLKNKALNHKKDKDVKK